MKISPIKYPYRQRVKTKIPEVVFIIDDAPRTGRDFVRGVAKYSRIHGPWVFYTSSLVYSYGVSKQKSLSEIMSWPLSGIIAHDSEVTKEILGSHIPLVVIAKERKVAGVPNVIRDDIGLGRIGAEHFLERGFKNLAYSGFDDAYWSKKRSESFKNTVADRGLQTHVYPFPDVDTRLSWQLERPVMIKWLKSLPKPIGIMACNDERAQFILDACLFAAISVPYDVAVIGVDNDERICEIANPSISSIEDNNEVAGYRAAEILHLLMKGKKPDELEIIAPINRLITRASTDILAVEDKIVADALRFIRDEGQKFIQVREVADAVACSRRTLDAKFCRVLGRTVHAEIKLVTIQSIIKMLLDTDFSVSQIAFKMGFISDDHISRYFKDGMGMSPSVYRKSHLTK
jgi:LacI family transcriptional regulator